MIQLILRSRSVRFTSSTAQRSLRSPTWRGLSSTPRAHGWPPVSAGLYGECQAGTFGPPPQSWTCVRYGLLNSQSWRALRRLSFPSYCPLSSDCELTDALAPTRIREHLYSLSLRPSAARTALSSIALSLLLLASIQRGHTLLAAITNAALVLLWRPAAVVGPALALSKMYAR